MAKRFPDFTKPYFPGTGRAAGRSALFYAALLLGTLFLSGCPHPVGWSGGTEGEAEYLMSWAEMVSRFESDAEVAGPVVYKLSRSDENSGPVDPLLGGLSCPGELIIEGNGKTVTLTEAGSLLTVGQGVTLTLRNITLKGFTGNEAALVTVDGGTALLEKGGVIRDNENLQQTGGGVCLNAGSFYLAGGEISNNRANYGGGVFIGAALSASGDGTFYLSGGELRDNYAGYGGGIYAHTDPGGGVFLTGGTILKNTASWGGGMYLEGMGSHEISGAAVVKENSAMITGGVHAEFFTMKGGSIRNNIGLHSGGGVSVSGEFKMSGGSISDNIVKSVRYDPAYGYAAVNDYYGSGVALENNAAKFTMSGTAVVTRDTVGGKRGASGMDSVIIYVDGPLTANPAANIILDVTEYSAAPKKTVVGGDLSGTNNFHRFLVYGEESRVHYMGYLEP
ncbi:MAG: hypothetical protein LBQ44_05115 [Treponema sp.]|jgi:hypothetical protein|nr:hypothetical protein [Treponema sp.]